MKVSSGKVAILSRLLILSDAFVFPSPVFFTSSAISTSTTAQSCPSSSRQSQLFSATSTSASVDSKGDISTNTDTDTDTDTETRSKTETKILADGDEFIKPTLDTRSYRSILLPNNLQALLVSDPQTDVEAGAVHIKAGHFDDPEDRPGLAHFNEHMLFLGTEKYPKEDDFEKFVGKNGGGTNAYTDMEDTNYYFSVAPLDHDDEEEEDVEGNNDGEEELDGKVSQALRGGLDRFAQFFISPLFSDAAVERELRAIDSEHINSFTSDSWRNYQLLKSSCNPLHPFAKFGCGNYNTLTNGGNITGEDAVSSGGSSPVPSLKKFWSEKYVSENMKLCVVGRASLDDLQKEVEVAFAGVRSNGEQKIEPKKKPNVIFQREHSKHGVAFNETHLGLLRECIPLVEERSIKLLFAAPPSDDPTVIDSRPDRVLTHLLGHESPGSLHALLLEEGLINGLSSGVGITASDFSMCSLSLSMTPKGMDQRDHVLSLVWQYINLVKTAVHSSSDSDSDSDSDDKVMEAYHEELRHISRTHFRFRENGDPTDFCSGASELLHDYEPKKLLIGSSMPGIYNATITKAYLERLSPDNCIINIQNSDFENEHEHEHKQEHGEDAEYECSAASEPWQYEKWYKAKYRQVRIADALKEKWSQSGETETDPRLYLPATNTFLPTDFSLRSNDPEAVAAADPDVDYSKEKPKLLIDKPGLKMWHKLDRTFKVPKTSLRLLLTTPNPYLTPRHMTYMRLYIKVLEDDLNSYIYDASLAGCRARVSSIPSGVAISVDGYSEKLPHLLDVVTGRMLSIIEEMKTADESSGLARKFEKATKNLLRETKNFRLESPYETSSYVSRMLLEHNVWHVSNYIAELEGEYAEKDPMNLKECAKVAEDSLTKRLLATFLCMGNINEEGAHEVVKLIDNNFLHNAIPLNFEEIPKLRSMVIPTKAEAVRIFGPEVQDRKIPIVQEEVTYSETEENHATELTLQCGSEHAMGYDGVAVLELIGQIAYNSAYNQLRTQEQLGYIVSAFTRKTSGSAMGLSVLVQSSSTKPVDLEEKMENWIALFREELDAMPAQEIANEAAAVVAQLLERNMRFGDEVAVTWGNVVSTTALGNLYNIPPFERSLRLAQALMVDDGTEVENVESDSSIVPRKTPDELKSLVLALWDKHIAADAPERRAMSTRVYGHKAKEDYESNVGKPGYLSSYNDARQLKQFLGQWPTAPYWIQKQQ